MFESLVAAVTGTSGAGAVDAWARVESAACARRLAAMVTMLDAAHAADGSAERDQWCIDNWAAVCAHIGATAHLTPGAASALLLVGTALRDRFPRVAAAFADGLIDYRLARTIITRTLLVTDPTALHQLDGELASALRTWAPMSQHATENTIDTLVARTDPAAVRRTHTRARTRSLDISCDDASGMAQVFGTLFATDAHALDTRLTTIADTVCSSDPRTRDQRRADALGALAMGADHLSCLCDTDGCTATTGTTAAGGVVVYVIAHHDTVTATEPEVGPDPATGPGPATPEPEETPADPAIEEVAGLDGQAPPLLSRPLREMTLSEVVAECAEPPGHPATLAPAALMGGQVLPGAIAHRVAQDATLVDVVHPGLAPPEPRYRPSQKLTAFIRCRDQTCRYPGCTVPATHCDIDHTIAYPVGPTQASNLKVLCRHHHLLKTFWHGEGGWRDRQRPNGDVTWTTPDGRHHTTTPGSRLLFPTLSAPTATVTATTVPTSSTAGLTMPRRRCTRTQDRQRRIDDERTLNALATKYRPAQHNPNASRYPGTDPGPPPF